MVGAGGDADVFDFGSDLEGGGGAFDFEVFGELDGVSVVEFVAVGIAEDEGFGGGGGFFG